MIETKTCNTCLETKDLELFTKGQKYKDGRTNRCKKCQSLWQEAYYKRNPSKRYRVDNTRKRHHLDLTDHAEMLQRYQGKCWICQERDATMIDHDHTCCDKRSSCGKCIRGLLCNKCNLALGLFGDDVVSLMRAVAYLQNPLIVSLVGQLHSPNM